MIVGVAGGVGGAKLARGLARIAGADLSVIVNTGDDFDHFDLRICPDLDTITYTLAGKANPVTGGGLEGDTWNFMAQGSASAGAPRRIPPPCDPEDRGAAWRESRSAADVGRAGPDPSGNGIRSPGL